MVVFREKWGENEVLVQNYPKLSKKNDIICACQKKKKNSNFASLWQS